VGRVRPTATGRGWLLSVAEALPLPHQAFRPYTLGEAVAELGDYAHTVGALGWNEKHAKDNRASLRNEIAAQSKTLAKRLRALVASDLVDLDDDSDPEAVVAAAARFNEAWHSETAITEAFRDLCDAAKAPGMTSRALRKLSAIIASQVGPAAYGPFSLLSQAANALVDTEEDLARWRDASPEPLTEALRVEMANNLLIAAPVGHVTVWVTYYRALVSRMREVAGPMTFFQADWALPNAFDSGPNVFPEGAELREIREDVRWLDDLNVESEKPESRLALVRVDLGERQVAGAVEEAQRRIDAILSVAVEAGGVSWQSAGAYAILLDGKARSSSLGLNLHEGATSTDSYGIGATSDLLTNILQQLDAALTKGPMPEHLVEALASLREARMTNHRDVTSYSARPVTPRVATALEDHAMELIARTLQVRPVPMVEALQRREALDQADRQVAGQLAAPFIDAWSREHHEGRANLEKKIFDYSQGRRLVSVATVVGLQAEIRELPMSDLECADFDDAVAICTDPDRERQLLDEMWSETSLLRARHRRVRNAINHGLPLAATTLNSIRNYAVETSTTALHLALTWFKNGDTGETLLQQEENAWTERMDRINHGLSWAVDSARTEQEPQNRQRTSTPSPGAAPLA